MKKAEIVRIDYIELTEKERKTLQDARKIIAEIMEVMNDTDCLNIESGYFEKNYADFEELSDFLEDLVDKDKLFLKEE